jgi:hypothetical protein
MQGTWVGLDGSGLVEWARSKRGGEGRRVDWAALMRAWNERMARCDGREGDY